MNIAESPRTGEMKGRRIVRMMATMERNSASVRNRAYRWYRDDEVKGYRASLYIKSTAHTVVVDDRVPANNVSRY